MENRLSRTIILPLQLKLRRYVIGDAYCSALLFNNTVYKHTTREGDQLHFYEQDAHGVGYGFVVIRLKHLQPLATTEKMLTEYLAGVRKPWDIIHHNTTDKAHLDDRVVITEYCQDANGLDWKLRGYTNGQTLAVLYAKNIGAAPVHEHDAFLNGFSFMPAT